MVSQRSQLWNCNLSELEANAHARSLQHFASYFSSKRRNILEDGRLEENPSGRSSRNPRA
jgi:hypothetical protein